MIIPTKKYLGVKIHHRIATIENILSEEKIRENMFVIAKNSLLLILFWKSLVLALPQTWHKQITAWHVHKRSAIKEMVKLSFMVFKNCEKNFPVFLPKAKRKGKEKNKSKEFYKGHNHCLCWKCVQFCLKNWVAHEFCLKNWPLMAFV